MHYFKMNIGDYAKKAGRLSMLEHGAYTLLIHSCYDRERFPTLEEALEWCWVRTDEEEAAVKFVLSKFFTLIDGLYVQNRIQEEIDKYHENALINKKIATEREDKRRNKTRTVNEACSSVNEPPPNQEPRTKEPLTINHKLITKNQEPRTINQELKELKTTKPESFSDGVENLPNPVQKISSIPKNKNKDLSPSHETWQAYSDAYQNRYGVTPVRNATVNAQLSSFIKRIGFDESPHVAAFYVYHNNQFYVTKMHTVGLLLADAEKLRTEWATKTTVTQTQARQADKTQARGNVFNKLIEEARANATQ